MARFNLDVDFDDFSNALNSVDFAYIAPKALKDSAPITERVLIEKSRAHVGKTGRMHASIKTYKVKKKGDGFTIFIGPSGTDRRGVRNMEKMAYLEYGVKGIDSLGRRRNQPPTPVLTTTIQETKEDVYDKMQDVFNDYLTSKHL